MNPKPESILFVCMGNICRSPLAEGIARLHLCRSDPSRYVLDSAGTIGYHSGDPPDPRAISTAAAHGVDISVQRARQFKPADFSRFDLILAMDRSNFDTLQRLREQMIPAASAELAMMLSYCGVGEGDVPDPYYGDLAGFEQVYQLLDKACAQLYQRLTHVKQR